MTYLIEAEWAQQQAEQDGVNLDALDALVAKRVATEAATQSGISRVDRAFQLRVDAVSQILRSYHAKTKPPTVNEIVAYYKNHRSELTTPAVRETRLIVTRDRRAALRARAMRSAGHSWDTVARRFSIDASSAVGGVSPVVRGVSPAPLVRAAFSIPKHHLVGPFRAHLPVGGPQPVYYLLEVTAAKPAQPQPLSRVRIQIRRRVEETSRSQALESFSRSFERRWRARTLCAPAYVVPQCRNYRAARTRGAGTETASDELWSRVTARHSACRQVSCPGR